MKQEDIQFLQQLQSKLLEAENDPKMHDYQAEPRFWVIMEKEEIETPDGESQRVVDAINGESYTFEEYIGCVENEVCTVHTVDMNKAWAKVDKSDINNVRGFAKDKFNHITNVINISLVDRIAPNTFFLTKEAAERHIQTYRYHYNKPRTYAMTAWRSPEFEKFLKLFKQLDFTQLKNNC